MKLTHSKIVGFFFNVLIIFLGLVVSGSNNENDGIEGKLIRSESEVYSDADADFSDNGLSPGIKQIFQQEWDNFKQRYFEFNKH